jgi:hypothetical protein
MFLTPDQLEQLTGKRRPSAQARWLQDRGWRFERNATGSVVVHALEAERQLCGGSKARRQRVGPDLEALNG